MGAWRRLDGRILWLEHSMPHVAGISQTMPDTQAIAPTPETWLRRSVASGSCFVRRGLMPRLRSALVVLRSGIRRALPAAALRWIATKRAPRFVDIELTTKCGLGCPLCPTHLVARGGEFLSDVHLARIVDGSPRLRRASLHLMGEPLEHPRVFDIVERLESTGIRTHIGTNAMGLLPLIDRVFDSQLSTISIAVDGTSADEHERYRSGGDFDRVTTAIRALRTERERRGLARPWIQLQGILFPYADVGSNQEDKARAFLGSFDPDAIKLKRPSTFTDVDAWFDGEELSSRTRSASKRAQAFVDLLEPAAGAETETRGKRLHRDQRLCPQLTKAHVLSDGRVVACMMDARGETAYGHLDQAPLSEIWHGKKRRDMLAAFQRSDIRLCSLCTLASG